MLDLQEIENTIEELENGSTTFDACLKLSALYTVRDHMKQQPTDSGKMISNAITNELADILPHYQKYVQVKTEYQLNRTNIETVKEYMSYVCKEVEEFLETLYSSTDTPEERFLLYNTFQKIVAKIAE